MTLPTPGDTWVYRPNPDHTTRRVVVIDTADPNGFIHGRSHREQRNHRGRWQPASPPRRTRIRYAGFLVQYRPAVIAVDPAGGVL